MLLFFEGLIISIATANDKNLIIEKIREIRRRPSCHLY